MDGVKREVINCIKDLELGNDGDERNDDHDASINFVGNNQGRGNRGRNNFRGNRAGNNSSSSSNPRLKPGSKLSSCVGCR